VMTPRRALIFDLDETLMADGADTWAALLATSAWACVRLAQLGQSHPRVTAETLAQAAHAHAQSLWARSPAADYCQRIGISAGEGLWGRFTGDDPGLQTLAAWTPGYQQGVWTGALAGLGVGAVPAHALAPELAARFRAERLPRQTLFPEVIEVLRAFQAQRAQYALALLTNGAPDVQRDKLTGAGLASYFEAIIISGEVGIGKPDPRIFAHTLATLAAAATAATAAVMVGDSLARDIAGARRSGLRAIWICRAADTAPAPADADETPDATPDATIGSLRELAGVL